MTLTLQSPSLDILPSFLDALDEGDFITMQLGLGDTPKSEIEANPSQYIQSITTPNPFSYTIEGWDYLVLEHELLWIVDGERFIGTLAIRYLADDAIIDFAGHIGMAIRPGLIGRGYGIRTIANLWVEIKEKFKRKEINNIIVTCDETNTASARLIEHFNGKLIKKQEITGKETSLQFLIFS